MPRFTHNPGRKHDLIAVDSDLYWPFAELNAVEQAGKIEAAKIYLVGEAKKIDHSAFLTEIRTASALLAVENVESLTMVFGSSNQ